MVSFEQALLVKAQSMYMRARRMLVVCGCLLVLNAIIMGLTLWLRAHLQAGCR